MSKFRNELKKSEPSAVPTKKPTTTHPTKCPSAERPTLNYSAAERQFHGSGFFCAADRPCVVTRNRIDSRPIPSEDPRCRFLNITAMPATRIASCSSRAAPRNPSAPIVAPKRSARSSPHSPPRAHKRTRSVRGAPRAKAAVARPVSVPSPAKRFRREDGIGDAPSESARHRRGCRFASSTRPSGPAFPAHFAGPPRCSAVASQMSVATYAG